MTDHSALAIVLVPCLTPTFQFAVLTHPPVDIPELAGGGAQESGVPVVCGVTRTQEGLPVSQRALRMFGLTSPRLVPFWASAFSFAKCHADVSVPYDPHLKHVSECFLFYRLGVYPLTPWVRMHVGVHRYSRAKTTFVARGCGPTGTTSTFRPRTLSGTTTHM